MINEKFGVTTNLKPLIDLLKYSILNSPYESFLMGNGFDFGEFPIKHIKIDKEKSEKTKGNVNFKVGTDEYGNKLFIINLNVFYNPENLIELDSFLNHELHHFYDFYKREGKETKTKGFIKVRNKLKLYNDNPITNKFYTMIYLSLDEEINARVQELYSDLKNGYDLKETKSYNECMMLLDYNINELNELENKEQIMERINELSKEINVDLYFNNFEKFKNYFENRFKNKGKKLLKKLLKISATYNQIEESLFEYSLTILGENVYKFFNNKDFKKLH